MKTRKLLGNLAGVAWLAIASSASSHAQTLINVDLANDGSTEMAAVLGTSTDTYNSFGPGSGNTTPAATAGQTLFANAVSSTGAATGVSISTSTGFNTYVDNTSDSPTPAFLMDGYAYNAVNGANAGILSVATTAFTLSGLAAYDGASFTLVVYGAGNNAGQGDTFTLSGASTAGGSTSGTDRNINNGAGDAYQEFTGTITGNTLTITAAPNDTSGDLSGGGPYTEVNGFQLSIAPLPEPSTWGLMVGGLAFLAFRLRRKQA